MMHILTRLLLFSRWICLTMEEGRVRVPPAVSERAQRPRVPVDDVGVAPRNVRAHAGRRTLQWHLACGIVHVNSWRRLMPSSASFIPKQLAVETQPNVSRPPMMLPPSRVPN